VIRVNFVVIQGAAYHDKCPKVEKTCNYTKNYQNKLVYILGVSRTYYSRQNVAREYCK